MNKSIKIKKKKKNFYRNNLSKILNFFLYKIYYFNKKNIKKIINFFSKKYNFHNLKKIFKKISFIIDKKILNIYKKKKIYKKINILYNLIVKLNNSHIYIYIYILYNKKNFFLIKIDLEIYTYKYLPLKIINYLISKFKSDIILINYKITKFINKKNIYNKYKIKSLQNFINKKYKKKYDLLDINLYNENIFQTKMIIKKINLKKNIFNYKNKKFNKKKKINILQLIWKEIKKIYYNKKKL